MTYGTPRHSITQNRRQLDLNKVNHKILLIKNLFGQIEDECEFALLLHEDSQKRQINPDIIDNLQVYFEIVKYIMNIAEVPENTCVVRAYLTSDNHVQRVEFYYTPIPVSSKNVEIDVRWLDVAE